MKWFTCIIEVPSHVQSVQYFHTRAETPVQAEENAYRWTLDGQSELSREKIDVPFVFEGRLWPQPLE